MTISVLIDRVSNYVLNPVIALLFALALVYFFWGVTELIRGAEEDAARTKGQQHILWGLIGMLIMVGVGGIIAIIKNTIANI
jgi:hypothetical protein